MRIRTLLLACTAALALAGAAAAQSPGPAYGALPPFRIAAIVRAAGFDPLFRPMRQGDTYVLRALDRNEVEYRLVIDAYTGRTVSIRATGDSRPYARTYRGEPGYAPGGPVYGRIFGPNDDRYDARYGYGAPRPSAPPQVRPPQTSKATPVLTPGPSKTTQVETPEPNKTAEAPTQAPTEAPLPRPRPYVMEATSSIPADAPKAEPQKTPPPPPAPQNPVPAVPPAPPADTPRNNGGAAMPPVTPLD